MVQKRSAAESSWVDTLLFWRFIPMILIVLPVSKLLRIIGWFRTRYREFTAHPERHAARVRRVQEQVRAKAGKGKPLCTARSSLFSVSIKEMHWKGKDNAVDLNELRDILELDEERMVLSVEPLVNMGAVSHYLEPRGLCLPVLPELDELTVGGLTAGYGIESSSHKHGLFFDCVESLDIVVASGEVLHCSREEHVDLFHAVSWSLGSLGFLVRVNLRVIRSKPYVRVEYTPCTRTELVRRFTELSNMKKDGPQFIEALLFNKDQGVLMVGNFTDNSEGLPVNNLRRYWARWYYTQVEDELHRGLPLNGEPTRVEAVTLNAWSHRHTFSLFWEMELMIPFANHWLFRYTLAWMMPVNFSLLKLTHTPSMQEFYEKSHVAQDFLVPIELMEESLLLSDDLFNIYPVWLCPHSVEKTEPQGAIYWRLDQKAPEGSLDMYVDVGIYGVSGYRKQGLEWWGPEAVSKMEQWLIKNKGYSALYAITELSREEFSSMFDRTLYDKVRQKYKAEGVFVDVYQKVRRSRPSERTWETKKSK